MILAKLGGGLLLATLLWVWAPCGAALAQTAGGVGLGGFTQMASLGGESRGLYGSAGRARGLFASESGGRSLLGPALPLSRQNGLTRARRARGDLLAPDLFARAPMAVMPGLAGDAQVQCLTEAIYFESRGEPLEGQVAVGEVVLNRVDAPNYPDEVCAVVHQGAQYAPACQFSYTCDGIPDRVTDGGAWDTAGRIARFLLDGGARKLSGNATHYHADYVSPRWARAYPRTAMLGRHIFYRQVPGA